MEFAEWILEKSSLLTGKLRNLNWNSNEKPYMLRGRAGVRPPMMSLLHL